MRSSGSRTSPSSEEPTRSMKTIVSGRRSARVEGGAEEAGSAPPRRSATARRKRRRSPMVRPSSLRSASVRSTNCSSSIRSTRKPSMRCSSPIDLSHSSTQPPAGVSEAGVSPQDGSRSLPRMAADYHARGEDCRASPENARSYPMRSVPGGVSKSERSPAQSTRACRTSGCLTMMCPSSSSRMPCPRQDRSCLFTLSRVAAISELISPCESRSWIRRPRPPSRP